MAIKKTERSEVKKLEEVITEGFTQVEKRFQRFEGFVVNGFARMDKKIDGVQVGLTQKIDAVKIELTEKIDDVRLELKSDIEKVSISLGDDIETLAQMTAREFKAVRSEIAHQNLIQDL